MWSGEALVTEYGRKRIRMPAQVFERECLACRATTDQLARAKTFTWPTPLDLTPGTGSKRAASASRNLGGCFMRNVSREAFEINV